MSQARTNVGSVLDRLDADAVRRWCALALAALRHHQHEINELNVYPVPDGDTGTNLVLTMTAAYQALLAESTGRAGPLPGGSGLIRLRHALHNMARGATLGARGNSGVILSQLLRGVADSLPAADPEPEVRGRVLAQALAGAVKSGYAAVAQPVEGTILTVAAASATAAIDCGSDELAVVVRAAAQAAGEALIRTPEQLPALARAGVVDAGGRGLVVLLDTLVEVVTGEVPVRARAPVADHRALAAVREMGSPRYGYEVQYLLDADEVTVARLRLRLAALGDSLVIVGAGAADPASVPTWNVHVHVNDVGAAIEAGVDAGRPHRIAVTRFADGSPPGSVPGSVPDSPPGPITPVAGPPGPADPETRAVVVIAGGPGLAELFTAEGATVVRLQPGCGPSTEDVLAAIRAAGAARVVVLPNDPNAHGVAAAAADEARQHGIKVRVVPTRSSVQGLAALAVRDPGRHFNEDLIAMAEAAGACRSAEVTVAVRDALTVAGQCVRGDVLGLIEGEVNLIGKDLRQTCVSLVDRLLAAGGELVTFITGADAPADLGSVLAAHVSQHWPFVQARVYAGGQPHYPLLVGVE